MFKTYIRELIDYSGLKAVLSVFLFFFMGLTQGIGLVMIIPLLKTLKLSGPDEGGVMAGINRFISNLFGGVGLQVNLFTVLGAYVVIVSLIAILKRYKEVLNISLQQGFVHHLRHRLYSALTYADWQFIVARKSSDITHAVTSDIQRVGQGTYYFLQLASEIALILFHVGAAFLLSFPLTAATLGFGAVMMWFIKPLNRKALDTGESFRISRKNLFGAVMEHLVGMKTAKSCGVEKQHLEKMRQINRGIEAQRIGFARVRANTRMFYEIAAVVALALYFAAALNIKALQVPVTQLLVLVFIFTRLMPRFSFTMQCIQNIKNMLPSFKGISQLYEQAASSREFVADGGENAVDIEQRVSFHGVSFRYSAGSETDALNNVSFDIPARQITAIVGPSGAGKSTLADLLLGLLKPGEGKITVDGKEISGHKIQAWRRSIGYVPQETFLFHDTVRTNLLWACPQAGEDELWEALDLAAADEFVRQLPDGLDTVVGDRGIRLSGGERQRLALARALLRKPRLLLLDEATSELDLTNEQRILQAIRSLEGKMTVVIIAHRLSTIQDADKIIVLDNGRVTGTGTWKSLRESLQTNKNWTFL